MIGILASVIVLILGGILYYKNTTPSITEDRAQESNTAWVPPQNLDGVKVQEYEAVQITGAAYQYDETPGNVEENLYQKPPWDQEGPMYDHASEEVQENDYLAPVPLEEQERNAPLSPIAEQTEEESSENNSEAVYDEAHELNNDNENSEYHSEDTDITDSSDNDDTAEPYYTPIDKNRDTTENAEFDL